MVSFINVRLTSDELSSQNSSSLFCDLCSKLFKNSSSLHLHRVKLHKLIENDTDECIFRKKRSKLTADGVCYRYFCPKIGCKYEFNENNLHFFRDRRSLKQHFDKVHSEKRFLCSVCRLCKFSLERDKRYHEKKCGQQQQCKVSSNNSGHVVVAANVAPVIIYQPIIVTPVIKVVESSTTQQNNSKGILYTTSFCANGKLMQIIF